MSESEVRERYAQSVNARNTDRRRNNTSGETGVSWDKRERRYAAYIYANGKHHRLGKFHTIAAAVAARRAGEARLWGDRT